VEALLPGRGDVTTSKACPAPGGYEVACNLHGILGYAPSFADSLAIAREHARGERPTPTAQA
jgi:hypothetical protein